MITIKDEVHDPDLPNWEEFGKLIARTPNEILSVAHTTVRSRLGFAGMHLSILRQAKNNSMKRAMCEDVIVNLVSSLEAIAHVLNGYYGFGIQQLTVRIDHRFFNDEKKHRARPELCLRCRLKKVNARLADALDELLKTDSPIDNWYRSLIEYRHQILHRQHVIAHQLQGVKGYFLPDDPNVMGPGKPYLDEKTKRFIIPNYRMRREIKQYTEESYQNTIDTVELIYLGILEHKK
jgi:hypothetical protein